MNKVHLTLASMLLLPGAATLAQSAVVPVPIQALLDARSPGEYQPFQFSPDSKWICYSVRRVRETRLGPEIYRTGIPWFGQGSRLWMQNTETGESIELAPGKGNNWMPSWSPDGHYLAFYSDRGGNDRAELWLMDMGSRKERRLTDLAVRWGPIQWTPDGKYLVVLANPLGIAPFQGRVYATKPDETPPGPRGETVRVFSYDPAGEQKQRGTEPWSLDSYLADLAIVDVATGKAERITTGKRIRSYWTSPNGSQIAYAVPAKFETAGSQQTLFDLSVFDRNTGTTRVVADAIRLSLDGQPVEWLPGGDALSYRSNGSAGTGDVFIVDLASRAAHKMTDFPSASRHRAYEFDLFWDSAGEYAYFVQRGALWRLSRSRNRSEQLASVPDRSLVLLGRGSQIWSPDGGESTVVLARDDRQKQSAFYRISLRDGKATLLLQENRSFAPDGRFLEAAISPNNRMIVYTVEDAQHPRDLWMSDATFKNPRRLTHINPDLDRYVMGGAKLVQWRALDGQALQGTLLLPAGYREGQKYPTIVYGYPGGMGSDDLNRFGLVDLVALGTMQLLATRGYAVFSPDAPMKVGEPVTSLTKSILPGVDKVVELGVADPERIGVMGHSAGGFGALALITQTTRFKAAVMGSGLGNWMAAFGGMWADGSARAISVTETGAAGMGGTPWEYRDRYIENSPVFYLDRVQTPLFMYHGSEDSAVPVGLGEEAFVDLRRLGKTVTYAKYMGEDHVPFAWRQGNQIDLLERIIEWFDKYLKP